MIRVTDHGNYIVNVVKEIHEKDTETNWKYNLFSKFVEGLQYLNSFMDKNNDENTITYIMPDFAKWSFIASVHKKSHTDGLYRNVYTIGMIFHPGCLEDDNSLSVEINPSNEPHWSFHS